MTLEAGTRLGHYEVVSSLGAGGMGEVYRAKDTKLGREVAIKLLLEEVASDPERLARFEREARVLASLNHNNIATLYGFEKEGDTSFLVMELVEGQTLADRIKRGAIPVGESLRIFLQIAEGLEAAHEKAVIHRDLKPANVKVSDDGHVKILDFGLAKAMAVEASASGDDGLSESPTLTLAATQRGQILGTAGYMAPEQARGKTVDKRADVWAFGVCLFEALSGKRVFEGEDASITLASVLKSDPEWERLPGDTPRKLRKLLRRCLSKDPRQRLHDIGDARLEIEEAIAAPEDEETPGAVIAKKRSPVPLVLAALAASTLTALAVWTLKPAPSPPERPVVRAVLSAAPSAPVGVISPVRDLALTSDGRVVVYQSEGSLYARPVDRLVGSQLAGEGARSPFLSPDGAWVGFLSGPRTLKRVSILGGSAVTLCELPALLAGASWGADDTIILGFLNEGLYRVSGGGGELELLVAPDPERGELAYRFPEMLPGGEVVLFTVFTSGNVEQAQIVALSLATGERKVLVSGGAGARYVPTGHLVYGLSGTLRAVAFDAGSLEVRGNPVPVLAGIVTKPLGAVNFDFSQDGSLVYVTGTAGAAQATLVWVGRDGQEEALSAPPRSYAYPRISPDGQRVAVYVTDEDQDVWIWDLGRETMDRLTVDPGRDTFPVWTPDSREVVFSSDRGGTFELFQKAADGTGTVKRLTEATEGRGLFPSSISPDGKFLVYHAGASVSDLRVLSLESEGSPEPLLASEFSERSGELSPDGRWLAYQSDESGENQIYVRPFPEVDGGRFPISAGGGSEPLWSPDGSEIFYRAGDRLMAVPVTTEPAFEAGSPEELFTRSYAVRIGRMYDIHPDGQRFLMVKPAETTEEGSRNDVVLVQNWFEELERLVPTD